MFGFKHGISGQKSPLGKTDVNATRSLNEKIRNYYDSAPPDARPDTLSKLLYTELKQAQPDKSSGPAVLLKALSDFRDELHYLSSPYTEKNQIRKKHLVEAICLSLNKFALKSFSHYELLGRVITEIRKPHQSEERSAPFQKKWEGFFAAIAEKLNSSVSGRHIRFPALDKLEQADILPAYTRKSRLATTTHTPPVKPGRPVKSAEKNKNSGSTLVSGATGPVSESQPVKKEEKKEEVKTDWEILREMEINIPTYLQKEHVEVISARSSHQLGYFVTADGTRYELLNRYEKLTEEEFSGLPLPIRQRILSNSLAGPGIQKTIHRIFSETVTLYGKMSKEEKGLVPEEVKRFLQTAILLYEESDEALRNIITSLQSSEIAGNEMEMVLDIIQNGLRKDLPSNIILEKLSDRLGNTGLKKLPAELADEIRKGSDIVSGLQKAFTTLTKAVDHQINSGLSQFPDSVIQMLANVPALKTSLTKTLIGSGNFGKVLLARKIEKDGTSAIVAIKKLTNPKLFKDIHKEVSIHQTLTETGNANILPLEESIVELSGSGEMRKEKAFYIVTPLGSYGGHFLSELVGPEHPAQSILDYMQKILEKKTEALNELSESPDLEEHQQEIIRTWASITELQAIAGPPLSAQEKTALIGYIGLNIAMGLDGMHSINAYHLDVALRNILVMPDTSIKLVDFGQAVDKKLVFSGSVSNESMAPEHLHALIGLAKRSSLDYGKVDGWSLGGLLCGLFMKSVFRTGDLSLTMYLEKLKKISLKYQALPEKNLPAIEKLAKEISEISEKFYNTLKNDLAHVTNESNRALIEGILGLLNPDPGQRMSLEEGIFLLMTFRDEGEKLLKRQIDAYEAVTTFAEKNNLHKEIEAYKKSEEY